MASQETIAEIFSLLTAQWPKDQATKLTLKVYELVLADIPDDVLRAAVVQLLTQATFRPTAAEVRKAAFDLMRGSQTSALEAWGEVKRMVGTPEEERIWSTPLILKALECLGGLAAFGFSLLEDEASWRARFCEAYETLAKRERTEMLMLPQVRALVARRTALLEGVAAATRTGGESHEE